MEIATIMNLSSLSIEDHQSEIGRFFDNNIFTFTVDIKSIVNILADNNEIKNCFKTHCNKIFLNRNDNEQEVLLDFDKTPYVTLDAAKVPVPYEGSAEEWLKSPVSLYVLVSVKSGPYWKTMAKPIYEIDEDSTVHDIIKCKLTDVLNIKPLISNLINICITDTISGYSYGNDNLLIKCDMRGKPFFANKQEDMDLAYLNDGVYTKDIVAIMDKTKYLTHISNEIIDHTVEYPYNITKICTMGDVITVFVGNDARILAWHKDRLAELERKKEYAELNGIPFR